MSKSEIRADYDQLEQVASRFAAQAEVARQLLERLRNGLEPLEQGGWVGRAAQVFVEEMYGEVLPACRRLVAALDEAASVTRAIGTVISSAEEAASAPLRTR